MSVSSVGMTSKAETLERMALNLNGIWHNHGTLNAAGGAATAIASVARDFLCPEEVLAVKDCLAVAELSSTGELLHAEQPFSGLEALEGDEVLKLSERFGTFDFGVGA